jgi:ABC-type transporter Mla subunit MlaD
MKAQLLQVGMQHAQALKDAAAAGEAKVEEAKKHFAEAEEQLRRELEEERELRKLEQDRNAELAAAQTSLGQMTKDTDAQVPSKCSFPLLASFHFLPVYSHTGFF